MRETWLYITATRQAGMTDNPTAPQVSTDETSLIRVLIIEDHRMFAEALARALADEPDIRVDGMASRLDDARDLLRREPIDVVIMDYRLPDGDGIVAARYIRREHPRTRVVMVTASEDRELLNEALAAGCSGFISKGESLVHLPSAIRSALVGNTAISPAMVAKLLEPRPKRRQGPGDDLTPRELDVLQLLANGWTNPEICDHLFMSPHTLRNYVTRINSKLGTHSKLEAASKALRLRLVRLDDERDESGDGGPAPVVIHRPSA